MEQERMREAQYRSAATSVATLQCRCSPAAASSSEYARRAWILDRILSFMSRKGS